MYVTAKEAATFHGVAIPTLRKWAQRGRIKHERIRRNFRYWVPDGGFSSAPPGPPGAGAAGGAVVAYARVSTHKQSSSGDLHRQLEHLLAQCPSATAISEVGSSLSIHRPGLLRLLERVGMGEISVVLISHRDRLSRFAYDFIEWYCHKHGARIMVVGNEGDPDHSSPESELCSDLITLTHSFSCRLYARRRWGHAHQAGTEQGDVSCCLDSATSDGRSEEYTPGAGQGGQPGTQQNGPLHPRPDHIAPKQARRKRWWTMTWVETYAPAEPPSMDVREPLLG